MASAERYLRRFPETSALHRVEGLEMLVRAAVAAGQIPHAEAALAELDATARRVATRPLLAMTRAAGAIVAVATGRTAEGRAGFEDAVDLYTRAGMAYDAAAARVDLAELLARDRPEAARGEAASALATFETMGATHLARRAAALEDRIARTLRRCAADGASEVLTPRQAQVLRHVAAGPTNREIAEELALSEKTVDRHLSNAFDRLGVSSRAAAAALAVGRDLI